MDDQRATDRGGEVDGSVGKWWQFSLKELLIWIAALCFLFCLFVTTWNTWGWFLAFWVTAQPGLLVIAALLYRRFPGITAVCVLLFVAMLVIQKLVPELMAPLR